MMGLAGDLCVELGFIGFVSWIFLDLGFGFQQFI